MSRSSSRLFICATVAFLAPAAIALADDTAEQAQRSNSVTIRGCLRGNVLTRLKSARSDEPAERFALAGSSKFLELLKQHSGHTEEATGEIKVSNPGGAAISAAKPVAKAGAAKPTPSQRAGKVIEVTGMTHVSRKCS